MAGNGVHIQDVRNRAHDTTQTQDSCDAASAAITAVLDAVEFSADVDDAIGASSRAIFETLAFDGFAIWKMDMKTGELRATECSGSLVSAWTRATAQTAVPQGTGTVGEAWVNAAAAACADFSSTEDPRAGTAGVGQCVVIPVTSNGNTVAIYEFVRAEVQSASDVERTAFRDLSRIASNVVTRLMDANRMQQMAADQWAYAESLSTRVEELMRGVLAAAEGDLTVDVQRKDTDDDVIGQMAESLATFFGDLRTSIGQIATHADGLAGSSSHLDAVSEEMLSDAQTTSDKASGAATSAQEVSTSMDTVSMGVDALSESILEISKSASEAARVADSASGMARETNTLIGALGESSSEIGQVIKLITSIAQQTNLLALNATIEAARAGEAGKGFAVVANEVKELAKETASAAEDIGRKIAAIQRDTEVAVKAVGDISQVIEQINDIQTNIACAVEEQTATAQDMSANVSRAARSGSTISSNVGDVSEAANATKANAADAKRAAESLSAMADELRGLVNRFRVD